MAVEEGHLQAVLEGRDLAAHRRLAEVQQFAGMGEAARLRHRVEDAQLVPIHNGGPECPLLGQANRSEEHTSELQSLMRISYAVFCLKKTTNIIPTTNSAR